jgi:hypothetical protein
MSASEKLKALVPAGSYLDVTWGNDKRLYDALPQIVAVVEAMHRTAYAEVNGAVDEAGRIWTRAEIQMAAIDDGRAALAALDEALP